MNAAATPDLTIERLEAGDIEPGSFNHEAHVYMGWLYVGEYPLPQAIERFTGALRRLVRKLGVESKYHDTMTWFYLLLIAERRAIMDDDDWLSFRRENADLFNSSPNILARYYSDELLWSDAARSQFVLPDRVA